MPTRHPRYAITETPEVRAALDELRDELGRDRIPLVVLGAHEKLTRLCAERGARSAARRRLGARIRKGDVPLGLGPRLNGRFLIDNSAWAPDGLILARTDLRFEGLWVAARGSL